MSKDDLRIHKIADEHSVFSLFASVVICAMILTIVLIIYNEQTFGKYHDECVSTHLQVNETYTLAQVLITDLKTNVTEIHYERILHNYSTTICDKYGFFRNANSDGK